MLKDQILPVAEKLSDNSYALEKEEEQYQHERRYRQSQQMDPGEEEAVIGAVSITALPHCIQCQGSKCFKMLHLPSGVFPIRNHFPHV